MCLLLLLQALPRCDARRCGRRWRRHLLTQLCHHVTTAGTVGGGSGGGIVVQGVIVVIMVVVGTCEGNGQT